MNSRNIVVQDNQLINAKYKLSRAELNFILLGIAQIKKEDVELTEYEIKVSDIEDKFNKQQNQTQLKVFAKKLMSKVLEVPTDDGWIIFNWFSKIQYVKGQAKFKVRIDIDLRPYLLQLRDKFTKYNLNNILPLTSNYSIRIYQFLKEVEFKNEKRRTFTVAELQELLQVPPSYKEKYNKFKTAVLLTAQKELQEHCDIYFEFDEIKEGKKVNEIVFKIKQNPKFSEAKEENQPKLFEPELSKEQKELNKFIGSKIEGHIIRGFRVVESDIYVETDAGDYRFLNLDTFLKNVS